MKPPRRTQRGTTIAVVVASAAIIGTAAGGAGVLSRPQFEAVSIDLDEENSLRGEVTIRGDQARSTEAIVVRERDSDESATRIVPPADGGQDEDDMVVVPLLGLRPERTYDIAIETDGRTQDVGALETKALPEGFPPIDVDRATGDPSTLTLFDSTHTPPEESDDKRDLGYLVVVDGTGSVVWYEPLEQPIEDARRTDEGNFLFVNDEIGAREIAPDGEIIGDWAGETALDVAPSDRFGRDVALPDATRVDTDQLHHEVVEAPNGNLISLSREVRTIEYPEQICPVGADDEPFDGTYEVGGDLVVEFDPDTGEVVEEFSLFDVVDPVDNLDRTDETEFCSPYLDRRYPDQAPVRDWSHANAVVIDEERNALLVSARHTDAVYALQWRDDDEGEAGDLLWTLGEDGDFVLEEDGEWFFHQHAPEVQEDGSILIYDNGNFRPGTDLEDPDWLPYSRAVRYEIDVEEGTARQVWEHRLPDDDHVYAPYVGDADRTEDATVLIAHGGLTTPLSHAPGKPDLELWARLIEVDEQSGDIVSDLSVRDPDREENWRIYRAERIDGLYPTGYDVTPAP